MTGIFLRIPAAEHALGHAGFDARNQTSSSYDRIWTKRLGRAQRLSSDDTKTGVPGTAYGPASQTCCLFSTVALSLSSISSTAFSTFFRIAILWVKRPKNHPRGL